VLIAVEGDDGVVGDIQDYREAAVPLAGRFFVLTRL